MTVVGLNFISVLTALKALGPQTFWFLPLGGTAIAEIGIVLLLSVSAEAIWSEVRQKNEKK